MATKKKDEKMHPMLHGHLDGMKGLKSMKGRLDKGTAAKPKKAKTKSHKSK